MNASDSGRYPVPLILASTSLRRQQILKDAELRFIVDPANIDESPLSDEAPTTLAIRLALMKARAVASRHSEGFIVGADTVVARGGTVFGKPTDLVDAHRILRALRDGPHDVVTGLAVVRAHDKRELTSAISAVVTMRQCSNEAIDAYLAIGESMDKAGAYAIQGEGRSLILRVDGPYLAVMGLPVDHMVALLQRLGFDG